MVTTAAYEKIRKAIAQNKTLTLTTYTYFTNEREYIDSILDLFLQETGLSRLKNNLAYCIHELGGNAKKANTKRVYFEEKDLDILDDTQYCIGMANFKNETIGNIDYYLKKQKQKRLYIKFQFQKKGNTLAIAVRNNIKLLPIEERRIREKIRQADRYSDIAEAFTAIEDSSEGAGLGIVMMILMLRNMGLSGKILRFEAAETETVFTLTIKIPSQA